MNRAVDGDVVAVQMLPKEQWKAATEEVIDADAALKNDDAEGGDGEGGADDDVEARLARKEAADAEANARSSRGEPQPTPKWLASSDATGALTSLTSMLIGQLVRAFESRRTDRLRHTCRPQASAYPYSHTPS